MRSLLSVLLLAALVPRCGSTGTTATHQAPVLDTTRISSEITRLMTAAHVTGLAITIFQNDTVAFMRGFGYAVDSTKRPLLPRTNLYAASLSKAVFGTLVMKLAHEGAIDLDEPLESYLPHPIHEYPETDKWHEDFRDLRTDSLYHRITARMCLSHTTGFPNWRWYQPDEKLRCLFAPGTRYSYSGEGLTYLQVVLEKITGRNIEDLMQEKLFKPLGMARSSYRWQPAFEDDYALGHDTAGTAYPKDKDNDARAASTMETTLEDMSRFCEALLQGKVLDAESRDAMWSPQIRIRSIKQFGPLAWRDSTMNDDIELSYGLGWGLLRSPAGPGAFKEGHGEGFQDYMILFPEQHKGVLIMTNSDNSESIFKELLELTIGDTWTPWYWEDYIPYNAAGTMR
jgi:D-alanyl-D-alanine-carboxypeptidase/D-alanyl-D-alanine-endopeptidase